MNFSFIGILIIAINILLSIFIQMLIKMDEAVKLNSELKKEYENQLRLFQHLRDSYEEKILLLSRDNKQKNENLVLEKSTLNSNKNNPDPQLQGSTP